MRAFCSSEHSMAEKRKSDGVDPEAKRNKEDVSLLHNITYIASEEILVRSINASWTLYKEHLATLSGMKVIYHFAIERLRDAKVNFRVQMAVGKSNKIPKFKLNVFAPDIATTFDPRTFICALEMMNKKYRRTTLEMLKKEVDELQINLGRVIDHQTTIFDKLLTQYNWDLRAKLTHEPHTLTLKFPTQSQEQLSRFLGHVNVSPRCPPSVLAHTASFVLVLLQRFDKLTTKVPPNCHALLQVGILNVLRNYSRPEGMRSAEISEKLGGTLYYNKKEFDFAIVRLMEDGEIYTTVDDNTFALTS